MKIGVTGGTGFIGQYLLREADENNQFVVLTSREASDLWIKSPYITYATGKYAYESFLNIFKECDAIVHLGAVRSNPDAEKEFRNYLVNIQVSEALFQAATDLGICNIVNISSTAVYDASVSMPFFEDGKTAPLSYYGAAKLVIENIAHLYNVRKKMKIKSLRLAQVLGVGERPGYMPTIFLEKCLKGEKLSVYGQGIGGKEYIYVKDVVTAIKCAYQNSQNEGVYNIGSGILTTNRELAEFYCSAFENPAGYELLVEKPENVVRHYMNVEKAKREIGFCAAYDVESALRDMKEQIKAENIV